MAQREDIVELFLLGLFAFFCLIMRGVDCIECEVIKEEGKRSLRHGLPEVILSIIEDMEDLVRRREGPAWYLTHGRAVDRMVQEPIVAAYRALTDRNNMDGTVATYLSREEQEIVVECVVDEASKAIHEGD